jgi:hypothetical protein
MRWWTGAEDALFLIARCASYDWIMSVYIHEIHIGIALAAMKIE